MKVLGAGCFSARELPTFSMPPAWRKATRNMVMATASLERALKQVDGLNVSGNPEVGFVLSSTAGELETSVDFIATWAKSKLARPVLFQNSLHNATTGFASIHFKIVGPVFTLSSTESAPQEALETAEILLQENSCRVCLVTIVEGHKALAHAMGEKDVIEGACTFVVTTDAHAKDLGLTARADLPELTTLNFSRNPQTAPLMDITDSGMFRLALELGART